eukprot:6207700-Pleurochrysis_carterae.AAC.7
MSTWPAGPQSKAPGRIWALDAQRSVDVGDQIEAINPLKGENKCADEVALESDGPCSQADDGWHEQCNEADIAQELGTEAIGDKIERAAITTDERDPTHTRRCAHVAESHEELRRNPTESFPAVAEGLVWHAHQPGKSDAKIVMTVTKVPSDLPATKWFSISPSPFKFSAGFALARFVFVRQPSMRMAKNMVK